MENTSETCFNTTTDSEKNRVDTSSSPSSSPPSSPSSSPSSSLSSSRLLAEPFPRKVRVLLVEDDLMNQLIMKAKLKEVGAILSERGRSNTKGLDPGATNTQLPGSVMMASNNKLVCSFYDVEMDVVVASTAEEALDKYAAANNHSSSHSDSGSGGKSQFNLMIMDQNLEGAGSVITGQDAVVQLRANDCTAPIIMCSGNCSKEVISP